MVGTTGATGKDDSMTREDAIYARQSANRADSISIESQIEFCEFETKGASHRVYIDKGFSGKNTDRPKFQEMMDAIKRGEIKRVICYKLDRCSRSVIDFVSMIEVLEQYDVEFVSCTEKFDTSTPMGRAMLNICIVFAQLERETIQMRVSDAYKSLSRKGFFMGGKVPYGFLREPYLLDGKRTTRLVPNPTEAAVVRLIFESFQDPKVSTGDAIRILVNAGYINPGSKDGSWSRGRIRHIISSPLYVMADKSIYDFFINNGAIVHNPPEDFLGINGCYLFEDKSLTRKQTRIKGHTLVLAPHEGYIPADIWLRCRKKSKYAGETTKNNKTRRSWLAGKIKCGKCGYALVIRLVPSISEKTYICSKEAASQKTCEGVGRHAAELLEAIVLNEMKHKLKKFSALSQKDHAPIDPRISDICAKMDEVQHDIDNLMLKLPDANSIAAKYINERVTALDQKKYELVQEMYDVQNILAREQSEQHTITEYMSRWEQLTISDKILVVDAMIKVIRVTEDKVQIEWKI